MAGMSSQLDKLMDMVIRGDYFTINRPRQYGKTTIMYLLEQRLGKDRDYLVLDMSFEGIDSPTYENHEWFITTVLDIMCDRLEFMGENQLVASIRDNKTIFNFTRLSALFTKMVLASGKKIILMIDEVDKSANNQLFLDFLGMLRDKYQQRKKGKDHTFHSVILAGVHDIKNLKAKIHPGEKRMYNSPWNIAVDFDVDLSLSPGDIAPMLQEYSAAEKINIDIPFFSENLFYFTSGYPFLVSCLCKIIAEKIIPHRKKKEWQPQDLVEAVRSILMENSTNFDTLIKNLENNPDLYEFVFQVIMNGLEFSYNPHNPIIQVGTMYGILKKENAVTRVHNRVYEQLIYDYMTSKLETSAGFKFHPTTASFILEDGSLNIGKVIRLKEILKFSHEDTRS